MSHLREVNCNRKRHVVKVESVIFTFKKVSENLQINLPLSLVPSMEIGLRIRFITSLFLNEVQGRHTGGGH